MGRRASTAFSFSSSSSTMSIATPFSSNFDTSAKIRSALASSLLSLGIIDFKRFIAIAFESTDRRISAVFSRPYLHGRPQTYFPNLSSKRKVASS